ncbi:MAG: pyruvate kinase [Rhodoblastus sp.]
MATLERLVGVPASRYPDLASIVDGDTLRRAARNTIFGSAPDAGPCLIVALPDVAEDDPRVVRDLMNAGMICARIDCARGDAARWCEMIVNIRIAERELGRSCQIMMDFARRRVACDPPDVARRLALGDRLRINDGRITAQVAARSEDDVHLEVAAARPKGEKIKPGRSVRRPGANLPASGRDDDDALDFVAKNADIVGHSLLNGAQDVSNLQQRLSLRRGGRPPMSLVLAVETPRAFANLADILVQASSVQPTAVLICDAAIAIECGPDRLGDLREEAFALCRAASVPAIWASAGVDNLTREGVAAAPEAASAIAGRRFDALAIDSGPCILEATQFIRDLFSAPVRNGHSSVLPPAA